MEILRPQCSEFLYITLIGKVLKKPYVLKSQLDEEIYNVILQKK